MKARNVFRNGAAIALAFALLLGAASLLGCSRGEKGGAGTDTYDASEATSVDVDLAFGEVVVHPGEQFSVAVERVNYPEIDVEVRDGVLHVKDRGSYTTTSPTTCKIDITVPEGTQLDSLGVALGAGKATVEGVAAQGMDIDIEAGEIEARNVTTSEAMLDVEAGSIIVTGFEGLNDTSVSLSTELGEVIFMGTSTGTSFQQDGTGATLTASVEAGSIEVR